MFSILIFFVVLASICSQPVVTSKCGPGTKRSDDGCVSLANRDILGSLNWLAKPPPVQCANMTTIQGISVCEDNLPKNCVIWSLISSNWCDHYGSLQFEIYWAKRGCLVTIYHYTIYFKGNVCAKNEDVFGNIPNLQVVRNDMWAGKCFNCFYKLMSLPLPTRVDVMKVQSREGVNEDFDGVQYTILSDLFLHVPDIRNQIMQVVFTASISSVTMSDTVGREGENAWNMWATQQFLSEYGAFSTTPEKGRLQPLQFSYTLEQARVDPTISFYHQSFMRIQDKPMLEKNQAAILSWKPTVVPALQAQAPAYCTVPSSDANQEMQQWIKQELNARCHPTRLWVTCDRKRGYDGFVPCPQELMNHLAADYASTKNWCDYKQSTANIQALTKVDKEAYIAFKKPKYRHRSTTASVYTNAAQEKHQYFTNDVRIAFFFTVYTDANFVARLLSRLYSDTHYYLFHMDAANNNVEFEDAMKKLKLQYAAQNNVFLAKDVPIVYGASTATILLTRAMAWFLEHSTGWDYFVPVTGSDYPLVPLHRLERILAFQQPPMPFVMAWTPGTSTHIFRLQKTHPVFEDDAGLALSIKTVLDERGRVLGAVPMEYRSSNFGPPLFCNDKRSFYHLDNRLNKSGSVMDSQWLFPRDKLPARGRAYAEENPADTSPSFDGEFRVWKKSDPATTGAYDRESVDYIVKSDEGRKYYHFFKNMLLGSEEHYYVSLLYNWPRTRSFVQTLSAETVWNTWELGLWEQSGGGFQTHTHFLTMAEWDAIAGFAKRGMFFARKFSMKKNKYLVDAIDERILLNATSDAGLYWPGFFETDITTPGKTWVAAHRANATAARVKQIHLRQHAKASHHLAVASSTAISDPAISSTTPAIKQNVAIVSADPIVDNFASAFVRRGKNFLKPIHP